MQHPLPEKVTPRSVGRPRRLTLDAILDAACDIGLERLEMTQLAERLGVGVGTLYGYVRGRDHLIRLASGHRAQRDAIPDRGQSWQEVLREHAATSFDMYCAWPQLIVQIASGGVSVHFGDTYLESLLAVLTARGIAAEDALSLYYEINQIVIGAAVGRLYLDWAQEAEAQEPGAGIDAGGLPPVVGSYAPSLERLIAAHEGKRAAVDDTITA